MRSPGPVGGDLLARRYRLIDRVGAGGMSVVWRARDEVLDRLVAVKWLGAELADDELFRDLVRREAWATARIKHPAVAAVYDYGEVSDRDGQSLAYVVMEMLDGESLADRLQRGPLPWREAVVDRGRGGRRARHRARAGRRAPRHQPGQRHAHLVRPARVRLRHRRADRRAGRRLDRLDLRHAGLRRPRAPRRPAGPDGDRRVLPRRAACSRCSPAAPPFPEDTWDPEAPLRPRVRAAAARPGRPARRRWPGSASAASPTIRLQRPPAREVADRLAAYTHPWWRGRVAMAAAAAGVVTAAAVVALVTWGPLGARPDRPAPTHGAPAATGARPAGPARRRAAVSASRAGGAPPAGHRHRPARARR